MHISRALRSVSTTGLAGVVLAGSLAVPGLATAAVTGVPAPSTGLQASVLAPVAATPVPVPAADVLDVDFRDGTAVDHAQNLSATMVGEPVFGTNPSRARSIVSFDGAQDAIKYPFKAQHAKLGTGFALECTFRYDAPTAPTSEKALCSAKEGGGMATVANSAGITFMAHIGGGYKNVSAPLQPGRWYHTLVVWDGSALTLYVDGVATATVAASGTYKAPGSNADSLVLGADTQPSDGVNFYSQSSVQSARVWSSPLSAEQAQAASDAAIAVPRAPQADVFEVDFRSGSADDTVGGLAATVWNTPELVDYAPLGRTVAKFDGSSAYYYDFSTKYDAVRNAISVECVFKYDADFEPNGGENRGNLCASKEAGGFAITQYGDEISFNPHVGGAYRSTKFKLTETDRWYHVVGTYDGAKVRLYVNGRLVATTSATGQVSRPTPAGAEIMVIGGDASNGKPSFFAPSHIASARIFSRAVALDEVLAMQAAAFGDRDASDLVTVRTSSPAAGERLTRATPLEVELNNAGAAGRDVSYALDGSPVEPGELVGAGMKSGTHTLTVDGHDHFGNVIAERVEFTSANIPASGGTETGQAKGSVTLSAVATNPSGGDVVTTFRRAEAVAAPSGEQGALAALPTTLEFAGEDVEVIEQAQLPGDGISTSSPSAKGLSYQRFDVPAGAGAGQEVSWTGTVDPTREVVLRLWNGTKWVAVDRARGTATGEVTLRGDVLATHRVGAEVPVLITGGDPFADDLDKPVADGFENPDDYDFSIAHLTDTQYLSEGAVEQETAAERDRWKLAYTSVTQWIADNAAKRKIAFAAHTGDVIEDLHSQTNFTPGYVANARAQFEVASQAQRILDEAGVVNSVLPGNHDNRYGTETGVDAMYNDFFGPDRYEAVQAQEGWRTQGASYHPWKPGDSSNSFNLFTASGIDFIVVNLGFGVDEEEIAWANQVLEQYKDRNAIVQTHAHTTPSTNPDGRKAGLSYDGNKVRNQVAAKNPNVFLVLSGHEHGVNIEVVRNLGEEGNNVVELLADYQFYKVSAGELGLAEIGGYNPNDGLQFGSSFFRLLQFDVDRAEMSVDTYSALLDNFGATEYDDRSRYNGKEDDFTLPVQLETRTTSFVTDAVTVVQPTDEVIGTTTARSGWPAQVSWGGLTAGETYAWYATSIDASSGDDLPGEVGQMAVFTAQSAGTDTKPPVITVGDVTEVVHGSAFDVMDGVIATDDTDGSITDLVRVTGAVNTSSLGTYTLVYSVADANGNQTSVTRTVRVVAPKAPVNTGAPAISGPAEAGALVHASMGEWDNTDGATMRVQWFRNGTPIAGATGTEYRTGEADRGRTLTVEVTAKVVGHDPVVARSAGFDVAAAPISGTPSDPGAGEADTLAPAKVRAAVDGRARVGKTVRLRVRVASAGDVIGKVKVTVGKRTRTARLKAADDGRLTLRLGKLKRGVHVIRVAYLGSSSTAAAHTVLRVRVVR